MASLEGASEGDEQRPLLSDTAHDARVRKQPQPHTSWSQRHLIISSVLIITSAMQGASFVSPAMNQLVESAACQQLHPNVTDWYHDKTCKRLDVQDRLALIMGWESTYALIPALATAIPYGVFTDKYGPKAMMFLVSLGGVVVQVGELVTTFYPRIFDLRGIWVSSFAGSMIGGGALGMEAMQYAIASLIATESNRTSVFFYMICLLQLNFVLSGPFVYWAMNISPVFAQLVGMAFMTVSLLLTLTLPNGLTTSNKRAALGTDEARPASVRQAFLRAFESIGEASVEFLKLFKRDTHLALLLVSLIFSTIGVRQSLIRQQYATNRYGWTWAEAGAMISLISMVALLVLAVLVPAASHWLLKRKTPFGKDLWIAKIGILALFFGSILVGLSRSTVQFIAAQSIYTIDMCYAPAITSVIAFLAGAESLEASGTGLVYMTVVFMRTIGSLVAGPIIFGVFRVGLSMGGDWIGLPFFFEALLQVFTVAVTFCIRERRSAVETAVDE